jgi:hypothetical protein
MASRRHLHLLVSDTVRELLARPSTVLKCSLGTPLSKMQVYSRRLRAAWVIWHREFKSV